MIPVRTLNSGYQIPLLGLGTYPMDGAAGAAAMARAIAAGYRRLDTAAKYGNEWAVGEAIKRSGVDRRELFVTSKLRGADHGRGRTRAAVAASLDRLRLDYLDLYLIHWPLPRLGRYAESYQAMLDLAAEGLIRSVGVSNFKPAQVVLRWAVQQGIAVIPKSSDPQRQRANLDIFRFSLTEAELAALATLDRAEGAAVDSDLRVEF